MKKYLKLLALLLAFCLLLGCGANKELEQAGEVQEDDFTFHTFPTDFVIETVGDDADDDFDFGDMSDLPLTQLDMLFTDVVANDFIPVRYVMIYNPRIYTDSDSTLNTGNLGTQVEAVMNKGGLENPVEDLSISQDILNDDLPQLQEGGRAGRIITPYQVGDTRDFYCYTSQSTDEPRITRHFTCRYAGTYCNIWTADTDMSDSLVQDYGDQFDNYIYENVVASFGEPRFSKNGGKVNLLYYPLPENLGGCFCILDLYANDEVTPSEITSYGVNTDHDILHINANFTQYDSMQTVMRSTMAHEFQHLICATNAFFAPNFTKCPTWFNEAMSGYIEEQLYPGVKEGASGHLSSFSESNRIRNGQSLYNFGKDRGDIGVYGSVYLFSEYLARLEGDHVFSNFHKYWRTSYSSTLSCAEALMNSVSIDTYMLVDAATPYPTNIPIDEMDETWMSKLALQYHLAVLQNNSANPEVFNDIVPQDLLYSQINPANIEGGGRIIVALQGDTFVIPEDADSGLFYIGLDKDFNPVTALIYH